MSVKRLRAQDVPSIESSFFCFAEVNVRVHGLLSTGVAGVVESHGMSNLMRRHVREVECVGRATNNPIPVIAVDLVELDDGSASAAPDIGYGDRAAAPGVPKRDGIDAIEGSTGKNRRRAARTEDLHTCGHLPPRDRGINFCEHGGGIEG